MSVTILHPGLETLLAEFSKSGVRELHLRNGDFELYLSNDAAACSPLRVASAPPSSPLVVLPAAPVPAAVPDNAVIVRAPNLGIFYRAPKPGAAAYVERGAIITAGSELCLIEVMKLFTAVRAKTGGRIHAILAEDGQMVAAGQPLFAILEA